MVAEVVSVFLFIWGFFVLFWRMQKRPLLQKTCSHQTIDSQRLVSELTIVIPARNEEENLPKLLHSLREFIELKGQVVVVDDQSIDSTAQVARNFGVSVITTDKKPEGWAGKNWACHQGALYLENLPEMTPYWLFTDADTEHSMQGLSRAVSCLKSQHGQLLTAIPYHDSKLIWERMMGPFHILVAIITDAFQTQPSPKRFFSIGQFLLFDSQFYKQSGGHSAVYSQLAEDLALAKKCFDFNGKFLALPETGIYKVRMYSSFKEFFKGWSRNFRLGMKYSSVMTWLEIILVFGACAGVDSYVQYFVLSTLFYVFQRKLGNFSLWGGLLYPFALLLFVVISFVAGIESVLQKPIRWKSREYSI